MPLCLFLAMGIATARAKRGETIAITGESGAAILTIPAPADKGFIILKSRGK